MKIQINGKMQSWIKILILKCSYYWKQSTCSVKSLLKFQGIYYRNRTNNSKMCEKLQKTQIGKAILRKRNKATGITCPDFKLHYKAIITKTVWSWL